MVSAYKMFSIELYDLEYNITCYCCFMLWAMLRSKRVRREPCICFICEDAVIHAGNLTSCVNGR